MGDVEVTRTVERTRAPLEISEPQPRVGSPYATGRALTMNLPDLGAAHLCSAFLYCDQGVCTRPDLGRAR